MSTEAPVCMPPQPQRRYPRLALPADCCDTHVHVIGPASVYALESQRNYTPVLSTLAMYRDVMAACGITRAVLVQPSVYGTDNRQLLEALHEGGAAFRGVVVPSKDTSDTELDTLHQLGVRGIRLNLANRQVVAVDEVLALCERVAERGWHLQVQVRWSTAAEGMLADIAARTAVPLVIDHMGRPPTMQAPKALLELLASGRGWVKLSAPYRLGAASVLPLVHALVAANPDQALWASDWPHTELFDTTPEDADLVDQLHDWLGDDGLRQRICADNPARLYGF